MTQSESEDLTNVPDDTGSGGIKSPVINNPAYSHQHCPPEIHRSCFCVRFIAEHTKLQEDSTKVGDLSFKKGGINKIVHFHMIYRTCIQCYIWFLVYVYTFHDINVIQSYII